MAVEDQVVQLFAATNGYLDRITVDKVERFLGELTDYVQANNADLLEKIAGGDWSDETVEQVDKAVKEFADDFGYDLDEEGHPVDQDSETPPARSDSADDSAEAEQEQEEEAVPA
jgi:F-type H+-transporting ATPase subunit alpha